MATARLSHTLRIQGLSCRLGGRHILRQLTLPPLFRGEVVALLGANGSGKSTLLKSIAGHIPCNSEVMELDGTDLNPLNARTRARLLRYLPQSLPESVHLTVTEAILVALKAREEIPINQALVQVQSVLMELDIATLATHYLDELSGGQKQLVGLAQALVHKPKVLLLDEPLASLDLNYQHHVMRLLRHVSRARRILTVVVLHDLNMALRYAEAALLLHEGSLVASGKPAQVISPAYLAQAFRVNARVEHNGMQHPYVFVDDLLEL